MTTTEKNADVEDRPLEDLLIFIRDSRGFDVMSSRLIGTFSGRCPLRCNCRRDQAYVVSTSHHSLTRPMTPRNLKWTRRQKPQRCKEDYVVFACEETSSSTAIVTQVTLTA